MRYNAVVPALFVDRPNRFVARVEIGGRTERVHVKNTGRLRELLRPGAVVYLCPSEKPERKTRYDLVTAEKDGRIVNVDSQAPNAAAAELLRRLFDGCALYPERTFGASRFDFYLEYEQRRIFVEVKGVTLEREGTALFPDAPTERGRRHLLELAGAVREGYEAYVLFLLQMRGSAAFSPNDETDPAFAEALRQAAAAGVGILCYDCDVTADSMTAREPVPVKL